MQTKLLEQFEKQKIINEIKLMLFAARDFLKNRNELHLYPDCFPIYDAGGYYGEAFGMVRTLVNLGYGDFGVDNGNGLKAWFNSLQQEVLKEEKEFGLEKRYNYYRDIVRLNSKYERTSNKYFEYNISEIKNIIETLKNYYNLYSTIKLSYLKVTKIEVLSTICKSILEEDMKETNDLILNFNFKLDTPFMYLEYITRSLVDKDVLKEGNYIILP